MISSGALPKVTFRSPPIPGPERVASSSVARPMSAAVGMIPSAAVKKITSAETLARSSPTASGMKGTNRYGQPCAVRRKRAPRTRFDPLLAIARREPMRSDGRSDPALADLDWAA